MRLPQIESDGRHFTLHIPSEAGGSHAVRIPVDQPEALSRILVARQKEADRRIGTGASPTQAMIDAFISAHGVAKAAPEPDFSNLDSLIARLGPIG